MFQPLEEKKRNLLAGQEKINATSKGKSTVEISQLKE